MSSIKLVHTGHPRLAVALKSLVVGLAAIFVLYKLSGSSAIVLISKPLVSAASSMNAAWTITSAERIFSSHTLTAEPGFGCFQSKSLATEPTGGWTVRPSACHTWLNWHTIASTRMENCARCCPCRSEARRGGTSVCRAVTGILVRKSLVPNWIKKGVMCHGHAFALRPVAAGLVLQHATGTVFLQHRHEFLQVCDPMCSTCMRLTPFRSNWSSSVWRSTEYSHRQCSKFYSRQPPSRLQVGSTGKLALIQDLQDMDYCSIVQCRNAHLGSSDVIESFFDLLKEYTEYWCLFWLGSQKCWLSCQQTQFAIASNKQANQ